MSQPHLTKSCLAMSPSLTVYGAGDLGTLAIKVYQDLYADARIYGVTKTDRRHEALKALNINPVIEHQTLPPSTNVLISIPPQPGLLNLIRQALENWDRTGAFLLISSTRVYAEESGNEVHENSQVTASSPLLEAETLVLDQGGMVLRLAGLYDEYKGPHRFIQEKKTTSGPANSFLNLIHTQDAAHLAVRCLQSGTARKIYLGCDDVPMSRQDFVNLVVSEPQNIHYTETNQLGKRCNNQWTRQALNWSPQYTSFKSWWERRHLSL